MTGMKNALNTKKEAKINSDVIGGIDGRLRYGTSTYSQAACLRLDTQVSRICILGVTLTLQILSVKNY